MVSLWFSISKMRFTVSSRKYRSWDTKTDSSIIVFQVLLQPFQRPDVKMVGRLIQEQYVWFFQQKARQCQPGSLPSGKRRYLFPVAFLSKRHARKDARDLALIGITAAESSDILPCSMHRSCSSSLRLSSSPSGFPAERELSYAGQPFFHLLFHLREPVRDAAQLLRSQSFRNRTAPSCFR